MTLSSTAQATLLMTSYFSKARNEDAKPLTNTEWGRFAFWLKDNNFTPADLLVPDAEAILEGWQDTKIPTSRITQLLGRGHSLALAVEKWQRAGLWIVTRADREYPQRLKDRLKTGSPPVLFGCGDKSLLGAGGLAVIGSRNASDDDLFFTQRVGANASDEGIAVVSGGARGVDEAAMKGAEDAGGRVIGVIADSLLKAATSTKWRRGLMDGRVVLISPFYPEAGFNVGNAMARNKYIYCLADSSLVIHSGKKGGTLNGAKENLRNRWVPLWVKPTEDKNAANAMLVEKGGQWCEANIQSLDVQSLLTPLAPAKLIEEEQQPDMFTTTINHGSEEPVPLGCSKSARTSSSNSKATESFANAKSIISTVADSNDNSTCFYQLFICEIAKLAANPISCEELANNTGLHKSQVNAWLKCAVSAGIVKKFNRPVRYQYVGAIHNP